jgi:hypothetical protein
MKRHCFNNRRSFARGCEPQSRGLPEKNGERKRWVAPRVVWISILMLGCTAEVRANQMPFNLDTNRSIVELRGTVLVFGLNHVLNYYFTHPHSRLTAWQGVIHANVSTNEITFTGGNRVVLMENGIWEPDTNGVPGFAPGDYGARVGNPSSPPPQVQVLGNVACRQWGFETISTNIAMQNGRFSARPVRMWFVPEEKSALDYRFVLTTNPGDPDLKPAGENSYVTDNVIASTSVVAAGRAWMSQALTNRTLTQAKLELEDGIETLTLPLEGWHTFTTVADSGYIVRFDLILDGTLVATRIPVMQLLLTEVPDGPFQLSWPPGYRLQRASSLEKDDWEDDAIESPLEIQPSLPAEYFRAVRINTPPQPPTQ